MWFRWMFLAFLTNGLSQFGLRILQGMGLAKTHAFLYLGFWYVTGLLAALIVFVVTVRRLHRWEILWGCLIGMFSIGCCAMQAMALGLNVPGVLVFPVTIGGSLSIVALIGVIVLREQLSLYGYLGVISGIAALMLLSTANV